MLQGTYFMLLESMPGKAEKLCF